VSQGGHAKKTLCCGSLALIFRSARPTLTAETSAQQLSRWPQPDAPIRAPPSDHLHVVKSDLPAYCELAASGARTRRISALMIAPSSLLWVTSITVARSRIHSSEKTHALIEQTAAAQ
jgi:hypothetical protein